MQVINCCQRRQIGGDAAGGALRIVWCSCGARGTPSFPTTNVGP
jgi:hypothetical protein